MNNRYVFIDVLRGASVLYIVGFWHLMNYTSAFPIYYNQITLRVTVIILGLFVFLSGYLLGRKTIAPSKEGIKSFYVKRFLRIYPLYLGAIGLFFLFHLSDNSALLKAGFLVSMFYGPPPPTLWFITMIMGFYLLAPLLICAQNHEAKFWTLASMIFVIIVLITLFSPTGDQRIVVYFPAFACGIYFVNLAQHKKHLLSFFSVGFLLSIILSLYVENFPERSLWSIPLATLGPALIFILSRRYENHIPNIKLFGILSYAGFVMYLIHRPVYHLMKLLYFPSMENLQVMYLVFLCLPLIILISLLIQRGYDNTLTFLSGILFLSHK